MFSYWIQRHDYTCKDEVTNISVDEAIRAFQTYDWDKERSSVVEGSGDRDCPAGIGIHNGHDDRENPTPQLLHVCPYDESSVFMNIHVPVTKKILGIFPSTREVVYYVERYPIEEVPDVIRLFFQDDIPQLLQRTQATRS